MDNEDYVQSPEKDTINMHENYEVEHWTNKLGVSRENLQEAVDAVGTSVEEIKKYLM
jgi:hypothetical protein